MSQPVRQNPKEMRGFSLVEVLVAAVIGLLTVLVIMQAISATEGQRRQVSGANTADSAGAIAMQTLQRTLYAAGAGMTGDFGNGDANNLFTSCYATTVGANNSAAGGPGAINLPANSFAPVSIWPAATVPAYLNAGFDADTDVIQVIGGGSDFFNGAGVTGGVMTWSPNRSFMIAPGTSTAFPVAGLHAGDLAMLVQAGVPCRIAQITYVSNRGTNVAGEAGCYDASLTAADRLELRFANGNFKSFYEGNCATAPVRASVWNVDPGGVAYAGGAPSVYSLGPPERFTLRAFGIRNGQLIACAPMYRNCTVAANWEVFADGVVALKAEMGWDSDGTPGIGAAEWVRTPPSAAATTGGGWAGLKAVRLVLVSRNKNMERDVITGAVCGPAWSGQTAQDTTCTGALSPSGIRLLTGNDGANWARYRYKVFETTVQLRSMYWSG